ncbi:hypothetical protein ACF06N_13660 [Streptomyces albidoflavus]
MSVGRVRADQPTAPGSQAERGYVYQQLIAYARVHPERTVPLKPRHRPCRPWCGVR